MISFRMLFFVSVSSDKADDDLEMTVVCHRPEGLDQLEAQTNFSKRELQVLYRGFKNVRDFHDAPQNKTEDFSAKIQ